MELFVVRSARRRYWLLLAVALGFTSMGILLLVVEKTALGSLVAIALILLFGTAAVVFGREIFDRRPRITIDESGVEDRTLGVGIIPWSEIEGAYGQDVQGNPFICLILRDARPWVAKLPAAKRAMIQANRAVGCMELNLNLSGTDAEPEQIYELILTLSARTRKTASE